MATLAATIDPISRCKNLVTARSGANTDHAAIQVDISAFVLLGFDFLRTESTTERLAEIRDQFSEQPKYSGAGHQ